MAMKRRTSRAAAIGLALIGAMALGFGLSACAWDDGWQPEGEASLLALAESGDETIGRGAEIVFALRNTGRTEIIRSVVCATLDTDRRRYYFMLVSEAAIGPGRLVYLSGRIGYDTAGERALADGLRVEAVYFD